MYIDIPVPGALGEGILFVALVAVIIFWIVLRFVPGE